LSKLQLPPEQVPVSHGLFVLQSELAVHSTHSKLLLHFVPPEHVPQLPPQPLSPHFLPSHCGSHMHVPLVHRPGLPPAALHAVVLGAFAAMHALRMHAPTLQSFVSALQSSFALHSTHCPKPTHLPPFGQGIGS
jgi:hypothetical protein